MASKDGSDGGDGLPSMRLSRTNVSHCSGGSDGKGKGSGGSCRSMAASTSSRSSLASGPNAASKVSSARSGVSSRQLVLQPPSRQQTEDDDDDHPLGEADHMEPEELPAPEPCRSIVSSNRSNASSSGNSSSGRSGREQNTTPATASPPAGEPLEEADVDSLSPPTLQAAAEKRTDEAFERAMQFINGIKDRSAIHRLHGAPLPLLHSIRAGHSCNHITASSNHSTTRSPSPPPSPLHLEKDAVQVAGGGIPSYTVGITTNELGVTIPFVTRAGCEGTFPLLQCPLSPPPPPPPPPPPIPPPEVAVDDLMARHSSARTVAPVASAVPLDRTLAKAASLRQALEAAVDGAVHGRPDDGMAAMLQWSGTARDPLASEALLEGLCIRDGTGAWVPDPVMVRAARSEAARQRVTAAEQLEQVERSRCVRDEAAAFEALTAAEVRSKAAAWGYAVRCELQRVRDRKRAEPAVTRCPANPHAPLDVTESDLVTWLMRKGWAPDQAALFAAGGVPNTTGDALSLPGTPQHHPPPPPPPPPPFTELTNLPHAVRPPAGKPSPRTPTLRGASPSPVPSQQLRWVRKEEVLADSVLVHWVRE